MNRSALIYMLIALVSMTIAGCAAPTPRHDTPPEPVPASARAEQARQLITDAVAPRLTVDRLGLNDTPLAALGLNPDRTLEVPPVERPDVVGYYRLGPRPGATGPAVILGHVNGGGRPGAFARLDTVRVGDRIVVDDQNRRTTFRVTRTATVPKERFPTAEVYSDTPDPELRLVTCGGAFNGEDYRDNVIVFATAQR